jgi:hypothetical protein
MIIAVTCIALLLLMYALYAFVLKRKGAVIGNFKNPGGQNLEEREKICVIPPHAVPTPVFCILA